MLILLITLSNAIWGFEGVGVNDVEMLIIVLERIRRLSFRAECRLGGRDGTRGGWRAMNVLRSGHQCRVGIQSFVSILSEINVNFRDIEWLSSNN